MSTDPRTGWYKLFIPELREVLGGLFIDPQIGSTFDPFPFIYGRIDADQVAFDIGLDAPLYAVDSVVLLGKDPGDEGRTEVLSGPEVAPGQEVLALKVQLRPLSMFADENTNRCYLPTDCVTCILPVKAKHPIINILVKMTTQSDLVLPPVGTMADGPRILNLDGKSLDKPPKV